MRILVTFALENEFAPWRALRGFHRLADEAFIAFEARIGEADVRVALTGAGPENARRLVCQALACAPDVYIASGLAGSLRATLRPGEIFAAAAVRDGNGDRIFRADAALLDAAVASGARRAKMLLTSERAILTADEKRGHSENADAVDMESAAGIREAAARGIAAIAVRGISDAADKDLPLDFNRVFDGQGHVQISRVMGELARAPHRLPALIRLGRESRRAAEALANFLDAYVQFLASNKKNSHIEPLAEVAAL